MNPTDIPNGFVVVGPSGKPILVDFDDNGKSTDRGTEIDISGWQKKMRDGQLPVNTLILVHAVVGEQQILLKHLQSNILQWNGRDATVFEIAKKGSLNPLAEKIRRDYIDRKSVSIRATMLP